MLHLPYLLSHLIHLLLVILYLILQSLNLFAKLFIIHGQFFVLRFIGFHLTHTMVLVFLFLKFLIFMSLNIIHLFDLKLQTLNILLLSWEGFLVFLILILYLLNNFSVCIPQTIDLFSQCLIFICHIFQILLIVLILLYLISQLIDFSSMSSNCLHIEFMPSIVINFHSLLLFC